MPKVKNTVTPLRLTLKEAIEDIDLIHEKGGGDLSRDDFAQVKGTSAKSSRFQMELVALRQYGLIQAGKITVDLTPLAKNIVMPESAKQRKEAIFKAFEAIDLFKEVHDKYKGGFLPESTFLANFIKTRWNDNNDAALNWTSNFIESGEFAGILIREDSKIRVLSAPNYGAESKGQVDKQDSNGLPLNPPNTSPPTPIGNIPFPLDSNRTVTVPSNFDEGDFEFLKIVLEAYIKKTKMNK